MEKSSKDKIIQYFAKGEIIITEGTPGDRLFRVISGEAVVCKRNLLNKMIPIAKLIEGEIFGEMFLFEASGKRSASVIANQDMRVEVFFENRILNELRDQPQELVSMLTAFNRRLQTVNNNLVNLFQLEALHVRPDRSLYLGDTTKL
ncbi:MAG: cyclic nucleotide-binding domain-containing protein [Cyanobacteria bacterium P01_H01_bin.74]